MSDDEGFDIRKAASAMREQYYRNPSADPKIYIPQWRKPKWWQAGRRRRERELKRIIEESRGHIVVLAPLSTGSEE